MDPTDSTLYEFGTQNNTYLSVEKHIHLHVLEEFRVAPIVTAHRTYRDTDGVRRHENPEPLAVSEVDHIVELRRQRDIEDSEPLEDPVPLEDSDHAVDEFHFVEDAGAIRPAPGDEVEPLEQG